ncbi:hypothetical protein LUZ61_015386 [Rhynchospora tenuis]|uniref:WD40 repeat-like protein n=1 Tax=Rhynchospora tenuis TaxID=198213 RepID=A0AAD5WCT8_9POAL|nr:hypothetical protein LUZ61_015386 [Rhynchospora tenuis]
MKCPSVAALWASTPPSHQITAAVTLPSTSSLFTGGSDGAVIRWSLSTPSIYPISLLSGHAASISSLTTTSDSSLLSICTAGVLCLWSGAASSRCRRRRKLPPWAGTPLIVKPDPLSSNHVFVLCGSAEHGGSVTHNSHSLRKYVVVVIDCVSLNVVKSVFHGGLSIGFPLEMGVFGSDVMLVDGNGRIQSLEVSEMSELDGHEGSVVSYASTSSDAGSMSIGENAEDLIQMVALDQEGKILALVYASRCLLKWVAEGNVIGEIPIVGSSLCREGSKDKLITGIFLPDVSFDVGGTGDDGIFRSLVLCSSNGTAMFYSISIVGNLFDYKPVCEIPPTSSTVEGREIFSFCQFNEFLVRVESECITVGESLLWQPYISTWSLESLSSSSYLSKKISEGGFPCEKSISRERIVSSSMVLSEDSFVPYAIVYGFSTGEIEVIRFMESMTGIGGIFPHISDKIFLGHTGPVLCLASHHMCTQARFTRALVSGSKDCTIRVWDLDTGNLLAVMHHHVAPVRQIVLPPDWTYQPWNDCFLSVGDDGCVALISLQTLQVERIFPGHTYFPSMVAWDGNKGYIACLCRNLRCCTDTVNLLYIWDLKTGALERVIRGAASNSMFDHFCNSIQKNTIAGGLLGGTTSASSLLLPVIKDPKIIKKVNKNTLNLQSKGPDLRPTRDVRDDMLGLRLGSNTAKQQHTSPKVVYQEKKKVPIRCSCPFPGIASLRFDLSAIMSPLAHESCHVSNEVTFKHGEELDSPAKQSKEGRMLRFSLCFLHLWGVDTELDRLLVEEMNVCKPEVCHITAGTVGDRGAMSLMFPGIEPTLELWRSSPEFCAMRSLTMVSLAQHMISLSRSCANASSALAAFYTRNFAEKVPDIKPPLLQLLVSFWQHPCEHVRMAARSLFHCAAPRAIPQPLAAPKNKNLTQEITSPTAKQSTDKELETSSIVTWLDAFEDQDWVSWINATTQDSMASNIIVAAALVVWYPSIVKDTVPSIVVNHLIKLLMSMNDRYSPTAAELLAEGMDQVWKNCLGQEMTQFIGDVLFQIECLSGTHGGNKNAAQSVTMREALIGILLPSLAMADVEGFLSVIEGQIWGTASDSPVHLVSLKTIIRVVRGSPKLLAPYLVKVVSYVLHTMDPTNLVMRKACVATSVISLREIARAFPMVSLNESMTRLAVGDAIGDVSKTSIGVYDMESVTKIRILDASAPPGLPVLLEGTSNTKVGTAISALSFSPDGEGLVAFSENGLMIRWWSLGSAWWERLSTRSLVPVQCTKLIFIPPWESFSPNSSRLSIMNSILGHDKRANQEAKACELSEADHMRLLIHNLDLSYRLQWVGVRAVKLTRHGQDLGTFQLS